MTNKVTDPKPSQSGLDDVSDALRLQGLGVVARGVAHEMANPVNIILMNAEVAQLSLQDPNPGDDLAEALTAIAKEARRLGAMAHQIYRFADAESFSADAVELEVGALCAKARKLLGSRPDRTGVAVQLPDSESGGARRLIAGETALALALALLIGRLIDAGADSVSVAADAADANTVVLTIAGGGLTGPPMFSGLTLAEQISADHRGALAVIDNGFRLTLPSAPNR